jgi:hypothetical protein
MPHTSAAYRPILMRDITFMRPAHSGNKRKDWCDLREFCFYFLRCSSLGVRALEIFVKSSRQRSSNEMETEPLRHHTKDVRLSRRQFPRSVRIAASGQCCWERSRAPRKPRLNIAVRIATQQRNARALVLRVGSEPDKPARVKLTIARKLAAVIPRAQLETITNALHLPNGLTVRQGKSPSFISARTGLELINSLRMGVQIFPR